MYRESRVETKDDRFGSRTRANHRGRSHVDSTAEWIEFIQSALSVFTRDSKPSLPAAVGEPTYLQDGSCRQFVVILRVVGGVAECHVTVAERTRHRGRRRASCQNASRQQSINQ